jgi:predicted transcriptional regulator
MAKQGPETQGEDLEDKKEMALQIISYIDNNPGQHYNNILRALKIAPGTLQYHLNRMERAKKIIVVRKKFYTRYFPKTMKHPVDQNIMVVLRQKIPRNLLLLLMEGSDKTGHELAELLNVTKSTLSYYTRQLEKLDVINITIDGREKRYSLKDPARIAELIKKHKKSFGDEMVDRFVEVWVRI